jgi:hypothetical protein
MRIGRAVVVGIAGASAMSALSAVLRVSGVPIQMELILGTMTGLAPGSGAFVLGLGIHLAIGALCGILYGYLFERVWDHGGASTGVILGAIHATLIGMMFGLTPQFHPHVPQGVADPGPYFANLGTFGVLSFFGMHLLYGAIVGGGYGHVVAEREWAPAGRL